MRRWVVLSFASVIGTVIGCSSESFDVASGDSEPATDAPADSATLPVDSADPDSTTTPDSAGEPDSASEPDSAAIDSTTDTAIVDAVTDSTMETAVDSPAETAADATDATPDVADAGSTLDAADTASPCTGASDGTSCGSGLICRGGACVAPSCGDSLVTGTEQCDDGNAAICDGCESCERRRVLVVPAGAYAQSDAVASALSSAGSACYEAWARVDAGAPSDAIYFSSTSGGSSSHFIARCLPALKVVSFAVENGSPPIEAKANIDCADGKFHHVAACRDVSGSTATLDLFWDGAKVATASGAASKIAAPTTVIIGGVTYGKDGLGGRIDEVRISNTRRYTTTFVPARRHTSDGNTIALWHFDEASGTTAFDSSGASRNLTLTGTSFADDLGYGTAVCNECYGKADGTACGGSTTKVCSSSSCVTAACATGDVRCTGDTLEQCKATRLGFETLATCGAGLCDAAGKECDECKSGWLSCAGNTPRSCDSNGHWSSLATCGGSTPTCVDGTCKSCFAVNVPGPARIGVTPNVDLSAGGCIEVWAKATVTDTTWPAVPLGVGGGVAGQTNSFFYCYAGNPGLQTFPSTGGTSIDGTQPCSDGAWHHWAACFDPAIPKTRFFFDGALVGEKSSVPEVSTQKLWVGGWGNYATTGRTVVDEVRVSSKTRYTTSFVPAKQFTLDTDTVMLLHFDAGSGTSELDAKGLFTATLPAEASWVSSCR